MSEASLAVQTPPRTSPRPHPPALEIFFDSQCPLCSREVAWMKGRTDPTQVGFTDIAADDFDIATTDRSLSQLMGSLHGRTADGAWLSGMDVIRAMYRAAGFGSWASATELSGLRQLFDFAYAVFARIRPYLQKPSSRTPACGDRCSKPRPAREARG